MKILILISLLFLIGCESLPKNPEAWMAREKNACLPTAIAFKQGLDRQNIWSEVVRYSYQKANGKYVGHAIVAYMYPPGHNKLWSYDYEGSWRIRAWKDNPLQIAQMTEDVRGRWENKVTFAEFLK